MMVTEDYLIDMDGNEFIVYQLDGDLITEVQDITNLTTYWRVSYEQVMTCRISESYVSFGKRKLLNSPPRLSSVSLEEYKKKLYSKADVMEREQ